MPLFLHTGLVQKYYGERLGWGGGEVGGGDDGGDYSKVGAYLNKYSTIL